MAKTSPGLAERGRASPERSEITLILDLTESDAAIEREVVAREHGAAAAAAVVKHRFREFADHMRSAHRGVDDGFHGGAHAFRDRERNCTVIYCKTCNQRWLFPDVGVRNGGAYILDYLWASGLRELAEAILNHRPARGVWAKVLLGFLDET